MRFLLILILFVFFGYAIGLVVMNNTEQEVNLLFMQAPASNLGLLLVVAIILGVLIGILLAIQLFKVIQNKWEIRGLKKEVKSLKSKLDDANKEIEHQKQLRVTPPVSEMADTETVVDAVTAEQPQQTQ